MRFINNMRKNAGLTIKDRIDAYISGSPDFIKPVIDKYKDELANDVLADKVVYGVNDDADNDKEVNIEGEAVKLGIQKN